jgi:hypothetical protein
MKATRGLLATSSAAAIPPPSPAAVRVQRLVDRLHGEAPKAYHWKETWNEFRDLAAHQPDLWGRRIYSPTAVEKAEYVARTCHRAYLRGVLPAGRAWAYLSGAIRAVYHELEQSP